MRIASVVSHSTSRHGRAAVPLLAGTIPAGRRLSSALNPVLNSCNGRLYENARSSLQLVVPGPNRSVSTAAAQSNTTPTGYCRVVHGSSVRCHAGSIPLSSEPSIHRGRYHSEYSDHSWLHTVRGRNALNRRRRRCASGAALPSRLNTKHHKFARNTLG